MREFKFRGWDSEHSEWVYGYYTKMPEGIRIINAIICKDEEEDWTRYYIHEPKTIGQYTGLKDKNGKEIYEGDIVKTVRDINGNFIDRLIKKYIVKWKSPRFYAEPIPKEHYLCMMDTETEYEIIGNIHETPELIK